MLLGALFALTPAHVFAADQPQWGEAWTRNMVSKEQHLPDSFALVTGRNIKWRVKLGTQTHSTPIIAGGRIYIGTNNEEPRDSTHKGDRGVFFCLDEQTGALLWQLVVPKRDEDAYMDWPRMGMSSEATVEGDRVYLVDNRGAVLCLDAKGMTNGNDGPFTNEAAYMTPSNTAKPKQEAGAETHPETLRPPADGKLIQPGDHDADIIWKFDMVADAGIWPHDAAHSSILIHGDHLYLNTANGVDNTHRRIRAPNAPSLIVLDKKTGRWLARDDEHIAPNVFHNTWASPSMAKVNDRDLLFFCAGNGIVYAFEPLGSNLPSGEKPVSLKKVWQFDFDPGSPKTNVHKYTSNRQQGPVNFYGMPVFADGRLYVAGGGDIWWGKNQAWLKCIDPSKAGDITTNGLIWSCPLQKHVLSTPAVSKGLVFIADCGRTFHCVEAATGKELWTHEIDGEVWASPYVADGKVYLGTRSGEFLIFAASREKTLFFDTEFSNPISATTTAANGVLYIATMNELFAVSETPPQIKVIPTPEQTNHTRFRSVLVGPGVNEPKPYPGYGGFVGWESIVRTKSSALLVAFSSGYWHASPPNSAKEGYPKLYQDYRKLGMPEIDAPRGGRAEIIRSEDNGKTWTAPQVLIDTEEDDRHPALAQLSDGTLVASFFTWPTTKVAIIRSTDDGKTWEQTPHYATAPYKWSATDGPILEMPDKSLLLAAYCGFRMEGEKSQLGIYRSTDKGENWTNIAQVKAAYDLDEPSIARLHDGTLVAIARREGALMWSRDDGHTWTDPVPLPMKMYDPWLLTLEDGTLLCCHGSYTPGKPGLRAILSPDGGHTWTAAGPDFGFSIDRDVYGYSRGIQLPDGSIYIVYIRNGGHNAGQLKEEAILAIRLRVLPGCKGIELLPAIPPR